RAAAPAPRARESQVMRVVRAAITRPYPRLRTTPRAAKPAESSTVSRLQAAAKRAAAVSAESQFIQSLRFPPILCGGKRGGDRVVFGGGVWYTGLYEIREKETAHERQGRIYPDLPGQHPPGGGGRPAGLSGAQERFFHRPGLGPVPRGLARRPVRAQRQRLPVPGGLSGAGAGE